MPLPFTRELFLTSPPLTGNDVIIAQNLLLRCENVKDDNLVANGVFEETSKIATLHFQEFNNLQQTGIIDEQTATLLLDLHSNDGLHLLYLPSFLSLLSYNLNSPSFFSSVLF